MTQNKSYHSFVFDTENRSFVGEFEEMYKEDLSGNFDSWHQDDLRFSEENCTYPASGLHL